MPDPVLPAPAPTPPLAESKRTAHLMARARELEASFLAEMLSYSGYGETSADFGGGIGEEQFTSFLRDEQAKLMVARGGIGLAEHIFRALEAGQKGGHHDG